MENVIGYELVLPNGNIVDVTESSYPDLYMGLKVRHLFSKNP